MAAASEPIREQVALLAPTPADADIAGSVLKQAGIASVALASVGELCAAIETGVGVVIFLEEVLSTPAIDELERSLARQPAWSSTPFIVLTRPAVAGRAVAAEVNRLPGALLIERPVRITNLLSAVRSCLDARRRQYAMRDLLEESRQAALQRAQLLKLAEASTRQAEAANRMKDEFLAVLSHELRTPLNAILGWAALLRRGSLTPEQTARAIESVERNSRLQAQLIDDLLDVSRVISGSLRLDVQPVQLDAVVSEAIATVMPGSVSKGVKIIPPSGDRQVLVRGDPARLQQVVWNLLTNAIKFTSRGGTISVDIDGSEGMARLRVTDTGEGIDLEFLPHVFERFRQADSSTTRQRGGLGLGLAIVRQLVELHGGSVEAHSVGKGHGTTFSVQLPLINAPILGKNASAPNATAERAVDADSPQVTLANRVVLVVDDDVESLQMASTAISATGARVYTADSAAAGVSLAARVRPAAIVCDISMPNEDGFGFLRKLRALDGLSEIPAIALTAHARDEDRRAVLQAGFCLHLAKPVDPAELVRAVAGVATAATNGENPRNKARH